MEPIWLKFFLGHFYYRMFIIQFTIKMMQSNKAKRSLTEKFVSLFRRSSQASVFNNSLVDLRTEAYLKNLIKKQLLIQIILLGGPTGKSVCMHKYLTNQTRFDLHHTVGLECGKKSIKEGDILSHLQIWDTCNGLKAFFPMVVNYFKKARVGIIFFNMTDKSSFKQVYGYINSWEDFHAQKYPSLIVVANFSDDKKNTQVTLKQGLKLANQFGVLYLESSSIFNVSHIFQLAKTLFFVQQRIGISEYEQEQQNLIKKAIYQESLNVDFQIKFLQLLKDQVLKLLYFLNNLISSLKNINLKQRLIDFLSLFRIIKKISQQMLNLATVQFLMRFYGDIQQIKAYDGNSNLYESTKSIKLYNKLNNQKIQLQKQLQSLNKDKQIQLQNSKQLQHQLDQLYQIIHKFEDKISTCKELYQQIWTTKANGTNQNSPWQFTTDLIAQLKGTQIETQTKREIMYCQKEIQNILTILKDIQKFNERMHEQLKQQQFIFEKFTNTIETEKMFHLSKVFINEINDKQKSISGDQDAKLKVQQEKKHDQLRKQTQQLQNKLDSVQQCNINIISDVINNYRPPQKLQVLMHNKNMIKLRKEMANNNSSK